VQAKQHQQAWAERLAVPIEYTNSIGMKFRLIPPGEFLMGSTAEERQSALENARAGEVPIVTARIPTEGPQHQVRITKPFYLGVNEVTQEEYRRVTGTNPSAFSRAGKNGDKVPGMDTSRFPVETVSWGDAVEFCRQLSAMPNEKSSGRVYHLPTEAEWQYACRAGTTTPFHFGNQLNGREANCDGEYPYGTETKGAYLERTTTVGSYQPNAYGLYDMHGNVWEWCQDWHSDDYYNHSPREDPAGPPTGSLRVGRGGSWDCPAGGCRSAYRGRRPPANGNSSIGFRVASVLVDASGR
jgi:formylglycine-generating enzyme required for sulfatase activity